MPQKRKSNKRTSKRRSNTYVNYNGSGFKDWYTDLKNKATNFSQNIEQKRISAKQELQKIREKGIRDWHKDREENKMSIKKYRELDELYSNNSLSINPIYEMIIYLINFSLLIYSIAPIEFMDTLNTPPLDKIDEVSLILTDDYSRRLFFDFYKARMYGYDTDKSNTTPYVFNRTTNREPTTKNIQKNIFINKLINSATFKDALKLNFTGPSFNGNLFNLIQKILESHFYYFNKNNNNLLDKLTNKKLVNEDITEQCSLMSQTTSDNMLMKFDFYGDILEDISQYKDFRVSNRANMMGTSKVGDLWKHFNAIYKSLINLCSANKMDSNKLSIQPSYNFKDSTPYYGEPMMDQPSFSSYDLVSPSLLPPPPPIPQSIQKLQIPSVPPRPILDNMRNLQAPPLPPRQISQVRRKLPAPPIPLRQKFIPFTGNSYTSSDIMSPSLLNGGKKRRKSSNKLRRK
jgi:hypothetical protein